MLPRSEPPTIITHLQRSCGIGWQQLHNHPDLGDVCFPAPQVYFLFRAILVVSLLFFAPKYHPRTLVFNNSSEIQSLAVLMVLTTARH